MAFFTRNLSRRTIAGNNDGNGARNDWHGRWLISVALLGGGALALFLAFYCIDHYLVSDTAQGPDGAIERYLSFSSERITDAVSALAAMIAAVLGIVITVVSIVVQLSADRYTGVARMFLADRTNQLVMVYYVVACAASVWLSMSLQSDWVPKTLLVVIMTATTVGLVLMLPYFKYVFWFLEPTNIVNRIRHQAVLTVKRAARADGAECGPLQVSALVAMEELTDITSNSISGKDKIIASRSVDALKDYCLDYLKVKNSADERWFQLGEGIRRNPDFVAMDDESLKDLQKRHTWFEWKILRQYLGIYNEALTTMRDICYLIAIDTRYIGERAAERKRAALDRQASGAATTQTTEPQATTTQATTTQATEPQATTTQATEPEATATNATADTTGQPDDEPGEPPVDKHDELIRLVFRFMNSYMRATINAKDVRTAYNVLNQYRKLVECMLDNGLGEFALEGVKHMNYYGRVSYDMQLTFVTETVAYDVSTLCSIAHKKHVPQQHDMLAQFLELDQPLQVQSQEKGLLGVRKAQVKLAAYYLSVGEQALARLIATDMADEPSERLLVIRDQLDRVRSKDFWEIIDRGRNFEYMPEKQRAQMPVFFSWLGLDVHALSPTRAATIPPPDDQT